MGAGSEVAHGGLVACFAAVCTVTGQRNKEDARPICGSEMQVSADIQELVVLDNTYNGARL